MYPKAFLFFIATLLFITTSSHTLPSTFSPIIGIDHIPLAVRDLDQAATFYRSIGFAPKPGRSHSNGIHNQHIKFRNGTELELITASQPHDSLTAEYCRLLKEGEGPAFWGLFTKDSDGVAKQLTAIGKAYQREGSMITFSETDRLHPLFFGGRNQSPTDKEEHFQHANSATNLIGVWIATSDSEAYTNLFKNLSLPITSQTKQTPFQKKKVALVSLPEGEIVFFPASAQVLKGCTIIGATISVSDMKQVQTSLRQAGLKNVSVTQNTDDTQSLFLPPSRTHGIWLEFRQTLQTLK